MKKKKKAFYPNIFDHKPKAYFGFGPCFDDHRIYLYLHFIWAIFNAWGAMMYIVKYCDKIIGHISLVSGHIYACIHGHIARAGNAATSAVNCYVNRASSPWPLSC